ncbi:MAG: bacteriocin ABC transporter permease [Zetaproteobacteria bacterium CG12_big_fil_rev_8_21_14_0_65_55_1124]|nr:MAG: hypothetical protein AUJ58_10385 [Zetaproteobacteria bacterium CG1_02_55_237]PIS18708.1 MAG: bacteriocin ABC transporter permease [Zetaproteobacteria bacterium CG08_land_8_20_14_0_20_55_17]PIW43683.1 MAG: bacteriocin ABC transporter permease [Zetaproteobacteria bacterium CG12_big_fil_rev_8_21_14_0_65_55_1124]PIY52648.1 MAG: bacteriocin ABC transporter permease [Zetaproteobacteria bacterium CG_4_10_14_0_8_um_filter_55_43]PIZ37832.1 MAG: bacteriocin ABC transporter permease [Zetaproteobac
MPENELREDHLFDELHVGLHDVDSLRRKAREAIQKKQFAKAGIAFATLAKQSPTDPDLALQAARCYEKAEGARDDALRWFLASSERYARQSYPTKSIAILRLYHKMAPNEHEGPKRIFRLCRDMDDFRERLLEFLSPKERAGHHWRSKDIFATIDDETFDDMLDAMELYYLKAGETLVQKDDEATSLFIVVEGRLDGYLTLNDERTRLGSIHPGDICGEIGYFLAGKRTAEVVAGEDSAVLELPYSKLDELRDKAPDFGDRLDHLYHSRMLANQLAVNDFFSEMSAALRNEIAHRMRPIVLQAGEKLFGENETTKDAYVVQSGEISVHLKLGKEQHLKDVSTGSLIGEFSVALGGKRTATARAISDCKLMQLPGDDYQELFDAHQELRDLLAKRKVMHMAEARAFIMNMDEDISDHICTAMLRMIWGASDV